MGLSDDLPIKLSLLRVSNTSGRARRIAVTSFVEWVVGSLREHTQHQVHTSFSTDTGAIYARNFFDLQFASHVAFCAMSERVVEHTGNRREFIGRNGSVSAPAGLDRSLSGTTGAGIDPCAALRCVLDLAPGETRALVVILGAVEGTEAAHRAVFDEDRVREACQR